MSNSSTHHQYSQSEALKATPYRCSSTGSLFMSKMEFEAYKAKDMCCSEKNREANRLKN